MRSVVVPSANSVPSSFEGFHELPMCLLPVNGEPLLNYFLEKYKSNALYVVSYFNSQLIDEYIDATPTKRVKNIKKTSLGDLADSILFGLRAIGRSDDGVIINFGDTLVSDEVPVGDCIFYSEDQRVDKRWTYLREEGGKIQEIVDKKDSFLSGTNLRLVVGLFSVSDVPLLVDLLTKQQACGGSFFDALRDYSFCHPFTFIKASKWLDFGHSEEYFNSVTEIKSRAFNHIEIDKHRGIIKKTSDNEEKLRREISWFLKLPSDLQYAVPRIYDYSLEPGNTFVSMEYYSYHTISDLFLYGDLSQNEWERIFQCLHFVERDFFSHKSADADVQKSLREMYLLKTKERMEQLRKNKAFDSIFKKGISINGVDYLPLEMVLQIMEKCVEKDLLRFDSFSVIHGDYCFANILVDNKKNFIKLIDPRGGFGECDIFGDYRYDLAKLFHSVDGKYDYIIKDKFDLSKKGNSFTFSIKCNKDLLGLLCSAFHDMIGSIKEIFLIEAMLFFTMIPMHQENLLHQYAMLLTGYLILDRVSDIKRRE